MLDSTPMQTITDRQADALRRAVEKRGDAEAALAAVETVREDPPWNRPRPLTFAEAAQRSNANLTKAQREARRANAAKASLAARPSRLKHAPSRRRPREPGWYVLSGGFYLGPFLYRSFAVKRLKARPGAELVRVE